MRWQGHEINCPSSWFCTRDLADKRSHNFKPPESPSVASTTESDQSRPLTGFAWVSRSGLLSSSGRELRRLIVACEIGIAPDPSYREYSDQKWLTCDHRQYYEAHRYATRTRTLPLRSPSSCGPDRFDAVSPYRVVRNRLRQHGR